MRSQDIDDEGAPDDHKWGSFKHSFFHRLVKDVYSAFGLAGLGKYERRVVDIMVDESWTLGYAGRSEGEAPEPRPVPLKACEIAAEHGYPCSRISEAIASLLARRIIVKVEGGYLINKSIDEWLDPRGRPALSPRELEICRRDAGKSRPKNLRNSVRERLTEFRKSESKLLRKTVRKVTENRKPELRNSVSENAAPQTPIEERGRKKDTDKIKMEDGGLDAGARKSRQLDSQPEYAEEATFGRIRGIVEQAAPNHAGTLPWRLWLASGYPPRLIERAVKMALTASDGKRPWPYALQVLEGWKVKGDPDDREPLPRLADHTAPAAPGPRNEIEAKWLRMKAVAEARKLEREREAVANG